MAPGGQMEVNTICTTRPGFAANARSRYAIREDQKAQMVEGFARRLIGGVTRRAVGFRAPARGS